MTLNTRRPTGLPAWPIILLAGGEGSGKSYAAAEASGSDLIGRTLWWSYAENDPDEYLNVPGADFEIVQHDGSYRGILDSLRDPDGFKPNDDGKPTLKIFDSYGRFWDMLSDQAQGYANERARRKAEKFGRAWDGTEDSDITSDLWNRAKGRWGDVLDALRAHPGPVILTARLEEVAVFDAAGQPTREKTWKVKAEKNLVYEVGAIVQYRAHREATLTSVKSLRVAIPPGSSLPVPDFTVDGLWRRLGLADGQIGARRHTSSSTETPEAQRRALLDAIKVKLEPAGVTAEDVAADWARAHDGGGIGTTDDLGGLELLLDDLTRQADLRAQEAAAK